MFCLNCSPFGYHNTKHNLTKNTEILKKDYGKCIYCHNQLKVKNRKFCSAKCQHEFEYEDYIEKWKNHEVDGTKGNYGQISDYVRKYIFKKYNNQCSKCGWSEINPYTNKIPLEIDHIDGNWKNSYEENLDLLCPNCHSLTKTYRGANRGRGRNITWIVKEDEFVNTN